MAHMPAAALVTGSTFTAAYTRGGTYSTTADNPVNIFRISQTWDPATVAWNSPWGAGGAYTGVGTSAQSVVYPAEGTVYTFSPGASYNFPYGVMMKGNQEGSITYRKRFLNSGPYPTLRVNYTPPAGTANGNIRSWAYLGHYAQGVTADHVTRINTDHVSGTYGGVSVDETTIAPNAANGSTGYSYGNSYGTYQWKQGTGSADVVNLLESGFYNAATKDNGTTYAAVYMYYTGDTSSTSYIGWGSDDDCKIYVNGVLRGSFLGNGRGASADNDFSGPFTLTQNTWYRVLLKVENGGGGYGLHLRFANANRTARSGCTFYTTDATAPSAPSSLAAAGVTSDVWQNSVPAPTFTWTSGTDSQGTGQGVSGVRGQKYYFGTSSGGTPGTFQTGLSYAPGTQTDGIKYFRVDTVDYALNESGVATFIFKYDATAPSAASLSIGTIGTDSISVTGDGTDATSGVNASSGYNYSRTGASDSGAKGTTHTWTGLSPNTLYEGLKVTVSDQAGNTTASSEHSKYTLIQTPAGVAFGMITLNSIDAAPSGTLNNLTAGTSGVRVSNTTAGNDSGWEQDTSGYTSSGLSANTAYSFVARAKNADGIETGDSATFSKYTLIETPATPTFGNVTTDSIELNTSGLSNPTAGSSGAYFDSTTAGGDGGINGWVSGTTDTATGLSANTEYTFQVMARNGDAVETGYSGTASKYTLIQTPTGVSFGTITETSVAAAPSGTLNNLAAGSSGVRVSNTTASNDSGWEQDTSGYTSSGLVANTEYTFVARAKNADGIETGDSTSASAWTLSVPPGAGSVTPDKPNPCADDPVTWAAPAGFGAGKVAKYKYVWDQNPTHTWTESEGDWSSGTIQTSPAGTGTWYLHVKGYNGANMGNGTYDYAVTIAPPSVGGTTSAAP